MTASLSPTPIATNVGFSEGPVIRPDGEIVFVSLSLGKLFRIRDGSTELFAELPGCPNGATEGLDGTIYVAQTGGRWDRNKTPDWSLHSGVQAVSRDGTVRWVSTDPIAPNDLCFGPDGLLWVTDPTRYRHPRDDGRLFRVDPQTGEAHILCSVPWYPNGIGFGLEDDAVYVANSGDAREIVRFPIDNGRLGKPETFCRLGIYSPDGFLFDVEGNLVVGGNSYAEYPGAILIFDRNGALIDTFHPGTNKLYTNVALGPDRMLIITASSDGAVLAVPNWPTAGVPLHPFR